MTPNRVFLPGNTLLSAPCYRYPQLGDLTLTGAANGVSKYDSRQIKVNMRFSHGLQANGNFSWAQGFTRGNPQGFFNADPKYENALTGTVRRGVPPSGVVTWLISPVTDRSGIRH